VNMFKAAALAVVMLALAACSKPPSPESNLPIEYQVAKYYAKDLGVNLDSMTMHKDGLYEQDLVVGQGERADSGDIAFVKYTGWLPNGTQFDSNVSSDSLFPVALGYGRVIKGWDQGVVGMHVGGRRMLVIPPALGYGVNRHGPIPANSTLVFDVQLDSLVNRVGS
jgi:FKBP-type peptidyl-prolyl cis-trans isomerase FkpA